MYNILISSRDVNFIKKILPILSYNIDNIRVTDITSNEKETITSILTGAIDIIIFDNCNNKLNIFKILEQIKNYFIFPFPLLIVVGSNILEFENCNKNSLIRKFINKNITTNNLIKIIKNLLLELQEKNTKEIYERNAFNELSKLGFKVSHNGTKYLVYSTIIVKLCKNDELTNTFEKHIYSIIASKYNTNIYNVKSNMLKAIAYAYKHMDREVLTNYFQIQDNSNATPKLIVSILSRKI